MDKVKRLDFKAGLEEGPGPIRILPLDEQHTAHYVHRIRKEPNRGDSCPHPECVVRSVLEG